MKSLGQPIAHWQELLILASNRTRYYGPWFSTGTRQGWGRSCLRAAVEPRRRSGMGNSSRLNGRMSACSRAFHRSPSAPIFIALLAVFATGAFLTGARAAAQGTHLWQQSQMEEFEKGTPAGVSIESDGHLRQGPGLTELVTTPSTYVWSIAADKKGTVFAGTGSPATVLRLGAKPGEKPFTLFETRDLSIQALRPRSGWRALCSYNAQRQSLQAESGRDHQAG